MNEHEALEAFFDEWHKQANEIGEILTQPQRDCAEEAWHAAIAWLRSQGEPVAYRYKQISPFGNHEQLEDWVLIDVPARIDSWSSSHGVTPEPLYLAPQPAIPDGWQSIETAPKDELILVGPIKRMGMCAAMNHSRDGWVTETPSEWVTIYTPTRWMPLPAAPKPGVAE